MDAENDYLLTQECVEWDETVHEKTPPPSAASQAPQGANLSADIEDLMARLGSSSPSLVVFPRHRRRRKRTVRHIVDPLKPTKRHSSTVVTSAQVDESFDELLKQLDNPQTSRRKSRATAGNDKQRRDGNKTKHPKPPVPLQPSRLNQPRLQRSKCSQDQQIAEVQLMSPCNLVPQKTVMPVPSRLDKNFGNSSISSTEKPATVRDVSQSNQSRQKPTNSPGKARRRKIVPTKEQLQRMQQQKEKAMALRRVKQTPKPKTDHQENPFLLPPADLSQDDHDGVNNKRQPVPIITTSPSKLVDTNMDTRCAIKAAGEQAKESHCVAKSQDASSDQCLTNTVVTAQCSATVDDVEFDEATLAELDQAIAKAVESKASSSQEDSCHGAPTQKEALGKNIVVDDLFDELSESDFAAIDLQIEKHHHQQRTESITREKKALNMPAVHRPAKNSLSPDFDFGCPTISFSRYRIVKVANDTASFVKGLFVKAWEPSMTDDLENRALHHPSTAFHPTKVSSDDDGDGWIILQGEWYHSKVQAGDTVHLCSLSGRYETNTTGLPVVLHTDPPAGSDEFDDLVLVLHPDILVPPTTIGETIGCNRRAVIKTRLGSTGLSSKSALYGTMRHDLFEMCMREQKLNLDSLFIFIDKIVREKAADLVSLGISNEEARVELRRVLSQIQQFSSMFNDFGKERRDIDQAGVMQGTTSGDVRLLVHSVHAAEESLVSHELGLKGNIDVIVKSTTKEIGSSQPSAPLKALSCIELKTGHSQKPQQYHMAQLALYVLLLRIRYEPTRAETSGTGMLLYLNNEGLRAFPISPIMRELKSLIGHRNLVAAELRQSLSPRGIELCFESDGGSPGGDWRVDVRTAPPTVLPEVVGSSNSCANCYASRECMLYAKAHKIIINDSQCSDLDSSHRDLLTHFTGHLTEEEIAYFNEWDRLVDLEADSTTQMITKAWLECGRDRERDTGMCIAGLVLDGRNATAGEVTAILSSKQQPTVTICLKRSKKFQAHSSFLKSNIEKGCHVVVSSDVSSVAASSETQRRSQRVRRSGRKAMHVARGLVQSVGDNFVWISVLEQEGKQIVSLSSSPAAREEGGFLFRIDRDEVSTGVGTLRQNLINLLTGDIPSLQNGPSDPRFRQKTLLKNRYSRLRGLIIHLQSPSFALSHSSDIFSVTGLGCGVPGCDSETLRSDFMALNEDQKRAVEKVFTAKDYALIQGLPGTGKSSIIVFITRLLVAHGKRVLITSYTHNAVDNLMLKLLEKGLADVSEDDQLPCIVRVGRLGSSHPGVHDILATRIGARAESQKDQPETSHLPSADSLRSTMAKARIVGATALTIPRSPLLVNQHFDVVIVDEAGQINQPTILGALMAADKFVLVGDHQQLPPLVSSEAAEQAGFGTSMLSRLAESHPAAVAQLTLQYRMVEEICRLCNEIAYHGGLKCANESVSRQRLIYPNKVGLEDWMSRLLDPDRPAVFADTDQVGDSKGSGSSLKVLERRLGKNGRGAVVNDFEAGLVERVLKSLVSLGVPVSTVGVICPFRSQLRLLNDRDGINRLKASGLEVSTIDKYQGRDKEIIIISFVRSNCKGKAGRLLNDYRRLNVAVSRAMRKLIMVGSYSTLLQGSSVIKPLLENMKLRNQVDSIL